MTRLSLRARLASRAIAAAAVAAVLSNAATVPVDAHDPDPTFSGGPMTPSSVLEWRWATSGIPTTMKGAIKAAAADANATRASKAPTFDHTAGVSSKIHYGTSVPCGVNGLACMRRSTPDWFGVWLRENGHRFDWGTLRWCEMTGSPTGCYQAETITLDELGHVLGLNHHVNYGDDRDYGDAVVQTYSHTKPRTGWNADGFARCDVASLQQMYDVLSSKTLYSTCLSVPTTLSMTASSSWVTAGSPVTFTAHLGTNGTGKLSNNKVTDRMVVLQQHLSTGWSDLVTMSGVSAGTYRATVGIRSDGDYRARFRKPSNEGLKASLSSVIAVSITGACRSGGCVTIDPLQ
jgi:hypothetical protein